MSQIVHPHRWLLLILALYVVLALAYSVLTPMWEAPDEPSHYAYAQYLLTERALPPPQPPQTANFYEKNYAVSLYEWYQPPLYYALVALPVSLVQWLHPSAQQYPPVNSEFARGAIRLFAAPATRMQEIVFTPIAQRVARIISIVLGLLTLLATYRLACILAPNDPALALAATSFMAFIPQFTFITSYVSNDNLADLISAASLLAFARILSGIDTAPSKDTARDSRASTVIAAGLLVALALLTKLTLLFLLPLGVLALLLRRTAIVTFARDAMLFSLVSLSVPALALLSPSVRAQFDFALTSLQVRVDYLSLQYVLALFPLTNSSVWGRFGWMNVPTPIWMATALDVIALVGLCGSLVVWLRGDARLRRQILLLLCACLLVLLGFLRFNLAVRQPQGRLLFPALSAFVLLVTFGLLHLAGRFRLVAACGLVCFTLALNLLSLVGTLLPAYVIESP